MRFSVPRRTARPLTTITPPISPATLLTVQDNPVPKGPGASQVGVQLSAAISLAGIDLGSGLRHHKARVESGCCNPRFGYSMCDFKNPIEMDVITRLISPCRRWTWGIYPDLDGSLPVLNSFDGSIEAAPNPITYTELSHSLTFFRLRGVVLLSITILGPERLGVVVT